MSIHVRCYCNHNYFLPLLTEGWLQILLIHHCSITVLMFPLLHVTMRSLCDWLPSRNVREALCHDRIEKARLIEVWFVALIRTNLRSVFMNDSTPDICWIVRQGLYLLKRHCLTGIRIPIMNLRRSSNNLYYEPQTVWQLSEVYDGNPYT